LRNHFKGNSISFANSKEFTKKICIDHMIPVTPKFCTVLNNNNIGVPSYKEVSFALNGNKDDNGEKSNESADPFSLFFLDYEPMLQKVFGKSTRPVLYALAMTISLKLGVIPADDQEGSFYKVMCVLKN